MVIVSLSGPLELYVALEKSGGLSNEIPSLLLVNLRQRVEVSPSLL